MANSRKPKSIELPGVVAAVLAPAISPGSDVVLALSGGVDSVTLLSILHELAPVLNFSLRAIHVNHGISVNAARWAEFCVRVCRNMHIPLQVVEVNIEPFKNEGLEGAARRARYQALTDVKADAIVLAHHRDDQAETLLLQMLRGAGMRGLAAMPVERSLPGSRAKLLRPFLHVSRAEIETCARSRSLEWVEDESNIDTARGRNFLRYEILPLLERNFPGTRAAIARSAAHAAEAALLLDEMARTDLHRGGDDIRIEFLREIGTARAKNVLRHACELRGIRMPGTAQLDELLRQLLEARYDAVIGFTMSNWQLHRYDGKLHFEQPRKRSDVTLRAHWNGENTLLLIDFGGTLKFKPEEGRGLSVKKLHREPVTVRLRQGGEMLQPDGRRPRRTLKNLFQEKRIPPWRRDRLPLLYCGENLVWVPGLGEDCGFQAAPGEPGLIVTWEPLA